MALKLFEELPENRKEMYEHIGKIYGYTAKEAYEITQDLSVKELNSIEQALNERENATKELERAINPKEKERIQKKIDNINKSAVKTNNLRYDKLIQQKVALAQATAFFEGERRTFKQQIAKQRNAIIQNHLNDSLDRLKEYGQNLVKISNNAVASPLCIDRQGRVYSVSIDVEGYDRLEPELWENGGGLFHPNCRHNMSAYFEGYSDEPTEPIYNKEKAEELYKITQEKNYIIRNKQKWFDRKKASVAVGDEKQRQYYNEKHKEWVQREKVLTSKYPEVV